MAPTTAAPVLITGGTGMQGRPTVCAALGRGLAVRVLVRDPTSEAARALAAQGAELVRGSFEDAASLAHALAGVRGVFSLQGAHPTEAAAQQQALIAAARRAGVEQFVQSTVSSTGRHETFSDWEKGRWFSWYWLEKHQQEERAKVFRYWTAVRPALLMDNFAQYRARFMHPELVERGEIVSATRADTPIAYVASETVGAAGAAALAEPERFHGRAMELADEMISLNQIAAVLANVCGTNVKVTSLPYAEAVARGVFEGIASAQDWCNVVGYAARPEQLAAYGLTPLPFRDWAMRHRDEIQIGSGS